MIISSSDINHANSIESHINRFMPHQICLSMSLHSSICKYDRIQLINSLLKKMSAEYRRINRRSYVESLLVIISDDVTSRTTCTILIKHNHQLLDKTVQNRIVMIRGLVKDIDANANIFIPYFGYVTDLQRYHLKNIKGSYSINNIKSNQVLELRGCVEY